jgi:curved DNA-binding protein CbpA
MTTTTMPDYYALLGLTQAATPAQIKRAYRRLARLHHPDMNPGDDDAAEQFRLLTEACDTLTDPDDRACYDATYQPSPGTGLSGYDPAAGRAASIVLAVLETTWHAIRSHHPEVPAVVIIIASGTDGRQSKWGHHAPARWHVGLDDRTEIMISGEGLRRDPRDVLGTLLHEAAHALAAARGIQDTSRQGRYHNRKYQAFAAELGITTSHDPQLGWSITSVPDQTASKYQTQLADLRAAMTLWRNDELTGPGAPRGNTNLIAAICPCGRSIRIAASVLAEAPVTCGLCDGDFTPKNPLDT